MVNIRKESCDVYIGRAGQGKDGYFGNPFRLEATMTRGVVGGLLYHGKPDRSFAVMIGGPFHGWSIHT